jgi:hypothetical protein
MYQYVEAFKIALGAIHIIHIIEKTPMICIFAPKHQNPQVMLFQRVTKSHLQRRSRHHGMNPPYTNSFAVESSSRATIEKRRSIRLTFSLLNSNGA